MKPSQVERKYNNGFGDKTPPRDCTRVFSLRAPVEEVPGWLLVHVECSSSVKDDESSVENNSVGGRRS